MEFKKAVKTKQWLRLAIDGISGSGKTFTALATAMGMAEAMKGKIALIDSEHGSASLYGDRFNFDTLDLLEFQIENYIEALKVAEENGYEIVIIDSTSHAWDALVERVERIAHQRFGGNTFRAWAEGTPLQKKLIEAMLSYPGHIIVTCRSKTEYSVDKDDKGKTTIKKVGTAAVQRQGFEYEFTMAMTMDANHIGAVSKDRTGKYQDKFIDKPGKEFGKQLIAWLNEGEIKPTPVSIALEKSLQEKYKDTMQEIGNILISKDDFGIALFSEKEQNEIRNNTKKDLAGLQKPEEKFVYICKVLENLTILLHKKFDTLDTKKETQPAETETLPDEIPASSEATNPENTETPASYEDENGVRPFEDDIPDDVPTKKKGKGKNAGNNELDIY